MRFAEIISLVSKYYWKQKVLGNHPSCLTFCKSPLTYVNTRELNFAISRARARHVYLLISTIANELSSSVYFRRPLFGLPSSAEGHLRALRTVRWASSRVRPREIGTSNENRFGESARRGEGRDTGNLWHAISHRMKTWCRHVDLAGATQTFRLFHRVLYGFHTMRCAPAAFLFLSFFTPRPHPLESESYMYFRARDLVSKIDMLPIISCMIFFQFMFRPKWS